MESLPGSNDHHHGDQHDPGDHHQNGHQYDPDDAVENFLRQKIILKIGRVWFNITKHIRNSVTGAEDGIQGWFGSTYICSKARSAVEALWLSN